MKSFSEEDRHQSLEFAAGLAKSSKELEPACWVAS